MPPINLAINRFLRDRVRAQFVIPLAPDLAPLPEELEDTTAEEQRRLVSQGVFPTARGEAAGARATAERAARQLVGQPGGILAFTQQTAVGGSAWLAAVAGPVPFTPFLLDTLTINVQAAAGAAGGTQSSSFSLLISATDDLTLPQLQADTPVILAGDGFTDGIPFARIRISGQWAEVYNVPINFQVPISPAFVKFLWVPAANSTLAATVSTTQLAPPVAAAGAIFMPPPGRISINLNTRPTRSRTRQRSTPRGARISVTQGGRTINQRVIAWESLAPGIKREWFNEQVSGERTKNVEWIP